MQRLAACGVLMALVLVCAPEAWSQTTGANITFSANTGIDRIQEAYTQARPWWISYADCLANDVFTFSLGLVDTSNPVEIWVGSENCATNRSNADGNRGQCWIVAKEDRPSDRPTIDVPVRNVIARRVNTTVVPSGLSADVCDDSTDPSGETLTFYIMQVDSGQADDFITWDGAPQGTGFDVVGPDPPDNISVGVGESQLAISVRDAEDEADLERFEAFCVPAGTNGTIFESADAGASEAVTPDIDAGSGFSSTGEPAPADCFTNLLRSGARPPVGYSCAVEGKTSSTLRTTILTNNQPYAVGVAGQDVLGNAGPLSNIECGTPLPLDDFFELYSRNGGPGGGGFCDLSRMPARSAPHGFAALGLLLAGLAYRRSRGRA